jgi:BirA family biotin operon repressor/biotin-[acetyl-CoA-carboxylase] ligase
MANSPHGFPLTAALSPRVQVTESTDSTNADVVRHVVDAPHDWPHLSLLLTTDQRAGRGRLDRSWVTPPGSALAVSVVVDAAGIPAEGRGWIPLIAGAAMTRAIAAQVADAGHSATLKWPNDVLLDGAKVCGILATMVPGHPDVAVIGSGVNTRMSREQLPVDTATSFAVVGLDCDEDRLLSDYLLAEVEALCGTLGSDVAVSLPDGATLWGRARRIDPDGRLVIVQDAEYESIVSAGDVVHVRTRAADPAP